MCAGSASLAERPLQLSTLAFQYSRQSEAEMREVFKCTRAVMLLHMPIHGHRVPCRTFVARATHVRRPTTDDRRSTLGDVAMRWAQLGGSRGESPGAKVRHFNMSATSLPARKPALMPSLHSGESVSSSRLGGQRRRHRRLSER